MKPMTILRQAFLNLFRNTRRTVMIGVILAASTMILFVTICYLEGMFRGMEMGYESASGSFQIARRGFWDVRREGDLLIDADLMEKVAEILEKETDVVQINQELSLRGLIGTEERSTIIAGMGVQAGHSGGYAGLGWIEIVQGFSLDKHDVEGILIGGPVAQKLGVGADDYVSLMATTVDGAMNLASARVAGVGVTGFDMADMYFTALNLEFVQSIRNTMSVERFLVFLREGSDRERLKKRLETGFAEAGLPLEIKTWEDLNPFYFDLKAFYDAIFIFIQIIISVLVFLSVMEIISMSFFERFRELGTLRAIGTFKGEVFLILLAEVFFYALGGIVLGALSGWGAAELLNAMNLTWTPPGATRGVPLRFFVRIEFLLSPVLIIVSASILAAVFPAHRSATKQIVEVLKYE